MQKVLNEMFLLLQNFNQVKLKLLLKELCAEHIYIFYINAQFWCVVLSVKLLLFVSA